MCGVDRRTGSCPQPPTGYGRHTSCRRTDRWPTAGGEGMGMTGFRQLGKRRITVVTAGVACLSAVAGGFLAAPAFGESAAARAAYATALVAGTPCTVTAKSCVDLEAHKAW